VRAVLPSHAHCGKPTLFEDSDQSKNTFQALSRTQGRMQEPKPDVDGPTVLKPDLGGSFQTSAAGHFLQLFLPVNAVTRASIASIDPALSLRT